MKNWKIMITGCLVSIVLLFTACNQGGQEQNNQTESQDEKEVIKIGAILPLTGPGAEFAHYIKEGIDLAVSEINQKSDSISFEILYEDSKTQPKEGVAAYNKLLATENPLVSIVALSSVARATRPIAEANNDLLIYTAVAIPGVADGQNTFRVYPEASGMSGVMAQFIAQELNHKKAAIIYINDDFGKSSLDIFKKEFNEYGGKVVFSESYEMQESDYKNQITKILSLSEKPDVIYLNGYGPAYGMILRQLRENKVDATITADMTMGLPNTLKIVGNLAEGIYYVDGVMSEAFSERYQQEFSKAPTSYAGYSYDIVNILNKAINSSETLSTADIANTLHELKYEGAMGKIDIQNNGESNLEFVVKKIVDGQPKIVE